MPNHSVARLDDTGSHDGADRGTIATSAKRTYLNHSLPARVGDAYVCPKHGANAIRTGSAKVWVESRRLARVGSKTWCGATIDSGAHNVTDGSAEIDPFADPACASGGFDITCIVRTMMAMQWPMAAKLMMQWFQRKANDDYASIPPDTTSVTLEWIEGFERGREAVAKISDPNFWFNQKAQAHLCTVLGRIGAFKDIPTTFGDFTIDRRELHKLHMQTESMGETRHENAIDGLIWSGFSEPDELDGALHDFSLHAVARGQVVPEAHGWKVTVDGIAIYMRDTYDFVNRDGSDQWLGRWDCAASTWARWPGTGNDVRNWDYQGYRQRTGQGGDYELFSPLRELVLSQPRTMICAWP